MFQNFDFEVITRSLPYLFLEGMQFTLILTILATIGGLALGTVLALMRLSSHRSLSTFAGTYVNLMRSLPLILVIFGSIFSAISGCVVDRFGAANRGRCIYFRFNYIHTF